MKGTTFKSKSDSKSCLHSFSNLIIPNIPMSLNSSHVKMNWYQWFWLCSFFRHDRAKPFKLWIGTMMKIYKQFGTIAENKEQQIYKKGQHMTTGNKDQRLYLLICLNLGFWEPYNEAFEVHDWYSRESLCFVKMEKLAQNVEKNTELSMTLHLVRFCFSSPF